MPDFDALPLDEYMVGDTVAAEETPGQAGEDEPTLEAELEDTGEDEPGGEDPAESGEEDGGTEVEDTSGEEEPTQPEPEDEDTFAPFDRKKIDEIKDPEVKKLVESAYKSFQAAFTKKTQELAAQRRKIEGIVAKAREALEERREFISMLESDEGAERFLVKLALKRPQVFEKAYERAVQLNEDAAERRRFEKEEEVEEKAARLERQERRALVERVHGATLKEAEAVGLRGSAVKVAIRYVANKILENRAATGKATITADEIREAVREAAEDLGLVRKQVMLERQKAQRVEIQKRASAVPRKRPAPAGNRTPAKKGGLPEPPKGKDRLDHLVDTLLGE